jgi:hypothetical protein
MTPNIAQLIGDHVSLSNTCIDRLYINGYLPALQTSGQLCYFLREHLGNLIPSPALFRPLHERFVGDIHRFVKTEGLEMVQFKRGERKDDIANAHRANFDKSHGVVFIGVAQEKASSFKAQKVKGPNGGVGFDFSRQWVAVNHYYFYLQDRNWGPAFIKIGTYLPYPVKLCLNGHEWAKQRLRREGIGFESLDNGFLSCEQPERLQRICDELNGTHVQAFFDDWSCHLPWPLTLKDRNAGYDHRLSIWQCEVSLTQVFNRPVQGRHFFEEVIRENIDLGRPERVSLAFPTQFNRRTPSPLRGYRTRVITSGVNPSIHIEYKQSHVKQYFKEEQALRTETTINNTWDFNINKQLDNLTHLRGRGEQINRKLLEVERVSQNCALTQNALDRLQKPTVVDEQRASALRFGDFRVMALFHALCLFFHLTFGFRNRDLREKVASLLGFSPDDYTQGKMSYDLRRLRLKGLIARIPGTNRYTVTTFGLQASFFYTKVYLRILRPGMAAICEPIESIPSPLRNAFAQIEKEISQMCDQAKLSKTG